MSELIPVNEPKLGARELEYVTEAVESGWISSAGRYIEEFEAGWAAYCGRRHGIAVSNGTTALHAAVAALGLGPGDEVILPTFTIVSCVTAVLAVGAVPVLVDSDPALWTMDVGQLEARVTEKTRAVMPVHMYGHPVEMDPLLELAERRGLTVLEDAAEAHGAEYRVGNGEWQRCGSFGAMSTFSFYANKLVTTGEGGMVVTDDDALAERLRSLRNLGFNADRRFHHLELGFNFRLTNLQAALGVAQLERIGEIVARKREVAAMYTAGLAAIEGLQLPSEAPWARSVFWMYGLVVDEATGLDAVELAARLRERGVDTRPFFLGMHEQPALHELGLFRDETYPVAERLARQGLYLPSGLALTDEQVERVCGALREALA
ncbi:MAG: DegT/DnrJ/EryC1/StrS family aminotransferase [Gaiellaceae bacterium]